MTTQSQARYSRSRSRRSTTGFRGSGAFYAFVSPWLIGTVLLTLFPLGYALWISFTNWDGIAPSQNWIGLKNYGEALSDPQTWASLQRTGLLAIVIVPLTICGGLGLALLLNEKVHFRAGFRMLVYLPAIVPPVAATLTWKLLFDRDSGAINGVLALFGADAVSWLTGNMVFVVLVVVMLWGIGGGVLINLAALQDVPAELHEAARLDGANAFMAFRHVTLPSISPILLFQVITTTIGVLQTFVPALLLSPATGPAAITAVPEANRVFMIDVYAQYFAYSRYGYASAMLWLFFLAILVITVLTFKIGGRTVFYAVDPSKEGKQG
ncbi:sugar ABC transporter permease [Arthrobacter sp. BE255]|uniref:carbohydrate ABC transporter permease n=1 Tax=Arthrobacter sp. BE255 TaxID=2817721 RepID=UPI00285FA818|nr:sugar ABC transporter permease [Arthrobacter sp. BE255]MDR7158384.1 multiple sugar transport system permease protein [Arthrobacter sp. BE255]